MKKDIINVLTYFDYFKYPPHLDELFLFLPTKTPQGNLLAELNKLKSSKIIAEINNRYAMGGHGRIFNIWAVRKAISNKRIKKINWFIKLLSKFPQFRLIGFTGGVSMLNSDKNDDIDVFVISSKNRMWTARFIAIVLSSVFRLRRSYKSNNYKDKLCFNLFFDESVLAIPDFKKNKYIAHEIVQMRPVVIKNAIYHQFLSKNIWVGSYFPNLNIKKHIQNNSKLLISRSFHSKSRKSLLGDIFETLVRNIQLHFINRHKTREIVTDKQLWFFPQDFQKKIKKNI